jgi:YHS domain-containing protein
MAHRTDVTQVPKGFPEQQSREEVTDPQCGMKFERKSARHVLFLPEQTHYFCSKECMERFRVALRGRKAA